MFIGHAVAQKIRRKRIIYRGVLLVLKGEISSLNVLTELQTEMTCTGDCAKILIAHFRYQPPEYAISKTPKLFLCFREEIFITIDILYASLLGEKRWPSPFKLSQNPVHAIHLSIK